MGAAGAFGCVAVSGAQGDTAAVSLFEVCRTEARNFPFCFLVLLAWWAVGRVWR